MIVPVKGVPFMSETKHEKLLKLIEKSDKLIHMQFENMSLDVPYGKIFKVIE